MRIPHAKLLELQQKNRQELEAEFKKKLEQIRSIDLAAQATSDESMKLLLEKLSEDERKHVDGQTADVAEGYAEMLAQFADFFEDPKSRRQIIEALSKRV